jgi:hypothetical protein
VAFNCIQDASLVAVQVQSRAAVIVTLTAPPPGGTGADGQPNVVWHRTPSGPTNVSTAVSPPHVDAAAAAIAIRHTIAARPAVSEVESR